MDEGEDAAASSVDAPLPDEQQQYGNQEQEEEDDGAVAVAMAVAATHACCWASRGLYRDLMP